MPRMSGLCFSSASRYFSTGLLMPRSITSNPAPSSIMDTRFLPMSWMSPLTVPITILPMGSTPVSASSGRRISIPAFMALAASSTSGTNRMPSRKSTPTMRMPSTSASLSTRSADQPRFRNRWVASSTSSFRPLYRSSCTCSVNSSSLSALKSNSPSVCSDISCLPGNLASRDRHLPSGTALNGKCCGAAALVKGRQWHTQKRQAWWELTLTGMGAGGRDQGRRRRGRVGR